MKKYKKFIASLLVSGALALCFTACGGGGGGGGGEGGEDGDSSDNNNETSSSAPAVDYAPDSFAGKNMSINGMTVRFYSSGGCGASVGTLNYSGRYVYSKTGKNQASLSFTISCSGNAIQSASLYNNGVLTFEGANRGNYSCVYSKREQYRMYRPSSSSWGPWITSVNISDENYGWSVSW